MLGVAAVCPGLHPADLRVGLVGTDSVEEQGQPGFVSTTDAAVVARLLQGDIIVTPVAKRLTEGDRIFYGTWFGVRTHAMTIRRRVLEHELRMLLERTAAVVQIMDFHGHVRGIAERNQFLLYRIPGKAVSDTEDADRQYDVNELQASSCRPHIRRLREQTDGRRSASPTPLFRARAPLRLPAR